MVGGLAPPPEEEEQQREREAHQQVIFVLESAQLETAQVGKVSLAVQAAWQRVQLQQQQRQQSMCMPGLRMQSCLKATAEWRTVCYRMPSDCSDVTCMRMGMASCKRAAVADSSACTVLPILPC